MYVYVKVTRLLVKKSTHQHGIYKSILNVYHMQFLFQVVFHIGKETLVRVSNEDDAPTYRPSLRLYSFAWRVSKM